MQKTEYEAWRKDIKERREECGFSQEEFASIAGISREYLQRIESGKKIASVKVLERINAALERFNPNISMTVLIDYCRIRFKTNNAKYVIEEILQIKFEYMASQDYAFYGYSNQYFWGDIVVMTSTDEDLGILLELKGKGCRQFEGILNCQKARHENRPRGWYDFFRDCFREDAVFKRIDFAINDKTGILDIPALIEKYNRDEYNSIFKKFSVYQSGSEVRVREDEDKKRVMGSTLYCGSMGSEIYFCIYQKDVEQLIKTGTPLEEAEIKNRFEIRLKNERAELAIEDLISNENPESTAFDIINRYLEFLEPDKKLPKEDWQIDKLWERFIGKNRGSLRLTTKPEPYTLQRTLNWLGRQVAPSFRMMEQLDVIHGTNFIDRMLDNVHFSPRQKKILEQQAQQALCMEDMLVNPFISKGGDASQ